MKKFNDVVHQYFDLLAAKHELRCVFSDSEMVRFESEKVFLQVRFNASRSFDLGVEIGQMPTSANEPERPFDLSEVLKLHKSSDATYVEHLQVSRLDLLPSVIEHLYLLVERYASSLLDGFVEDFVELGDFRNRECYLYAKTRSLMYARENVEKAWLSKNYQEVVAEYRAFEGDLTEVERKRLAFAEKYLESKKSNTNR